MIPAPISSSSRNTPTLIPMSVNVTIGPDSESDRDTRRAAWRGAAVLPPVVA